MQAEPRRHNPFARSKVPANSARRASVSLCLSVSLTLTHTHPMTAQTGHLRLEVSTAKHSSPLTGTALCSQGMKRHLRPRGHSRGWKKPPRGRRGKGGKKRLPLISGERPLLSLRPEPTNGPKGRKVTEGTPGKAWALQTPRGRAPPTAS